jgi:hypothetical protein
VDVVGKLFGLLDGLAVGDLVGVPVASGLALGADVVGKLFGLADGLAVGDLVGVPVASGLASPLSACQQLYKL